MYTGATALSDVPLSILHRSTLLASNLEEEEAHGSSEFAITYPAGYLKSWLASLEALESSCFIDDGQLLPFIKVSSSTDQFDDSAPLKCTFLR